MDLADGRGRVSSEVVIGQTSPGEWGCNGQPHAGLRLEENAAMRHTSTGSDWQGNGRQGNNEAAMRQTSTGRGIGRGMGGKGMTMR